MNSQNRMNAGAEYVLYRIWAALQDRNGIHAESLLTCVGALAGYACQVYVRQSAALPGADPGAYALRAVEAADGATYLYGHALNVPLADGPLSVWALVGRTVRKLGEPLPDIEDIFRHVTQTVGTSTFGVPRAPDGRRPRHPASVYLKQVWPQILPIAQRFCNKPMQMPVLFGIALQRAIEETKDRLSPTLGASIAMECAVAMSKVALPGADANPPITGPAAIAADRNSATPLATRERMRTPTPMAKRAPFRATPVSRRRRGSGAEASAPRVATLVARLPPSARIVAIAFLAFITIAGAMYESDRKQAPDAAPEVRQLVSQKLPEGMRPLGQPTQEAQASEEQQRSEEAGAPGAPPGEPADGVMNAESPPQLDSSTDGSDEIVIHDDPVAPEN